MPITIEQIAEACHEVNRAFCRGMGDFSHLPWAEAPEWQRASAIDGVRFHAEQIAQGLTPAPDASHNNWLAHKTRDGWSWGPEKRPDLRQHPCFMPYDQLPEHERVKDTLFSSVIRGLLSASRS